MRVSFAMFADAANLSQEGKLNILGVFDAVQVGTLPSMHPRATLVVRFKGDRSDVGSHTVTFRWRNPAGQELWSSNGEMNVGDPPPGVNDMDMPLIAAIDLPLDSPGTYRMDIEINGSAHATVRLEVRGEVLAMRAPAGGLVS